MTRRMSRLLILLAVTAALVVSAAALVPDARAQRPQRFFEAELFFELNDTDGDLGIHASIDGEPWTDLEIEAPGDRNLLNIFSRGQLRTQGLTQLFFESAEPSFDELNPADFFRRFPEGLYEIEGRAQGGGTIESTAVLSHVLAAPPENILVSGAPAAESCDAAPLPTVSAPVIIDWDPVTRSHPEIGKQGPIKVSRYQLFVEGEGVNLGLDLPPTVTEFEIPMGLTNLGKEFKFEIIVRTTTGNNTAVESCFRLHWRFAQGSSRSADSVHRFRGRRHDAFEPEIDRHVAVLLVGMRDHAHEKRQLGQLEAGLSHLDHFVRLGVGQRRERGVADRERFLERGQQLRLGFFLVGVERLRAVAGDEIAVARLRIRNVGHRLAKRTNLWYGPESEMFLGHLFDHGAEVSLHGLVVVPLDFGDVRRRGLRVRAGGG